MSLFLCLLCAGPGGDALRARRTAPDLGDSASRGAAGEARGKPGGGAAQPAIGAYSHCVLFGGSSHRPRS